METSLLKTLAGKHRSTDAIALFMTTVAGVPQEMIAGMRHAPMWPGMEALAPTLLYDATVMGDSTLPPNLAPSVKIPTLVLTGGNSGAWANAATHALTAALPISEHRVLDGQSHAVSWDVLAPELKEWLHRSA